MASYYSIELKIDEENSIFLTDDGLEGGEECALEVFGVDAIRLESHGSTLLSINKKPIQQIIETEGKGETLEIHIETVLTDIFNDIVIAINETIISGLTVIGTEGETGDFEVEVYPQLPNPFSYQKFQEGRVKNTVLRFVTK